MGTLKYSLVFLALLIHATCSIAIEVEEAPPVFVKNGVTLVELKGRWLAITSIPENAPQFKVYPFRPDEFKDSTVTPGCKVSKSEAVFALDAYYSKTAYDPQSIKIRSLSVPDPVFATWCNNPWLISSCLDTKANGGAPVTFEVIGKNANGGLTGWQKKLLFIRKAPIDGDCPADAADTDLPQAGR